MSRFKYLFLLLALGILSVSGCGSKETGTEEASSPKTTSKAELTSTKLVWHSFEEGLRLASETNRPVYLFIDAKWCSWCKKMRRETFTDTQVKQAFSNLIPVTIDGESRETAVYQGNSYSLAQLSRQVFGVRGFPTSVFLEPNGDIIGGMPGYIKAQDMVVIANYIGEGHYKNRSFEDYMKEVGS